jgi:hypothetical protein
MQITGTREAYCERLRTEWQHSLSVCLLWRECVTRNYTLIHVLWDVTLWQLVNSYGRFERTCCRRLIC